MIFFSLDDIVKFSKFVNYMFIKVKYLFFIGQNKFIILFFFLW